MLLLTEHDMGLTRCYYGMDVGWLTTRKAELLEAISAATKRGTSFTQPDVSMTFPSLEDLRNELAEVNAALAAAGGNDNAIMVAKLR
jgi:hypothetical protein